MPTIVKSIEETLPETRWRHWYR